MSANPLLDQLRAIPEGGRLTLDAFTKFIADAVKVDDHFFGFNEVNNQVSRSYSSTVFYSGRQPVGWVEPFAKPISIENGN